MYTFDAVSFWYGDVEMVWILDPDGDPIFMVSLAYADAALSHLNK